MIETSNESQVIDYAANNFERDWNNAQLLAKFENNTYNDIVFTSPFTLSHKISDYCLGWTLSQPNITIVNEESVFRSVQYPAPVMMIDRFVLASETLFDFSKLDYT